MKLGIFDLEIKAIGHNEFDAVLSYNSVVFLNWGSFSTKEAALSSTIQNCKKIFGAALDDAHEPRFRVKSKTVDAVQWFPEMKIDGFSLNSGAYYYKDQYIERGDWIVDEKVVTNKEFLEGHECVE